MSRRKAMKEREDRELDLATKFMQMGKSLVTEGEENKDLSIQQMGTIMVFMGGLLLGPNSDEDVFKFGDLCSMFSAKKILENMDENSLKSSSTYEDLIERLRDMNENDDDDE